MKMEPVTILALCVIVATGAGFGAGWGLKPDTSAEVLEQQALVLKDLSEGQTALVEAASQPIVIDAELRATLAEVPVQCRRDSGGDPMSPACQWATCLQYGQSMAQRPECSAVRDLMVDVLADKSCPDSESD